MICIFCKGSVVDSTTTFTVNLGKMVVVIKNVPCHKCIQCGEESFSFEVTEHLEKIIDSFDESLTELAFVNYSAA